MDFLIPLVTFFLLIPVVPLYISFFIQFHRFLYPFPSLFLMVFLKCVTALSLLSIFSLLKVFLFISIYLFFIAFSVYPSSPPLSPFFLINTVLSCFLSSLNNYLLQTTHPNNFFFFFNPATLSLLSFTLQLCLPLSHYFLPFFSFFPNIY